MERWKYLLLLVLAMVGCRMLESGSQPRTGQSSAGPVRPGVIPISPTNASIEFTGSTTLASHTGYFAGFNGTLEMPTDDPKNAKIHVTIDINSTATKIGLLTKHLKGEEFFDAARYPTAEFTSGQITPTGEAGRYQITGQLIFHGVQKPITFLARIIVTPDEITLDGTLTIRQTEFGMVEAARKTQNDVPVTVSVRGRRK